MSDDKRQIIVCYEKHGEYFYDASTEEQWARSALHILTDRFEQGWWYDEPEDPAPYDGLSREQIEALDDPDLRKVAVEKYNRHQRRVRSYNIEKQQYDELARIVREQDTSIIEYKSGRREPTAWRILYDRGDHEYERVTLETVHCP